MRSEHIAFVDSFDLNENRIGFEGKHSTEKKMSSMILTRERVRKRKIDNKTLMMLHEYWIVNAEYTSVGIILAHNAIVYELTPAEKNSRQPIRPSSVPQMLLRD